MSVLAELASALAGGTVRVIDLTHTLAPDFPTIVLPPELGQCAPFRMEEISRYDGAGPAWYWNNLSMGEHTGTHFDAPIHWITGRSLSNNATDTIPPVDFIAPACMIDCADACAADPDFLLGIPHVEAWEGRHGRIPEHAWVLLRTDWHKRSPAAFANLREDGPHTPGPAPDLVPWLIEQRNIRGLGTETIGTDAGQAAHFNPPYPAHHYLHASGRYGLQCLAHLDQLPPTGAMLLAAPLKIRAGSGSPLRVLALVEAAP